MFDDHYGLTGKPFQLTADLGCYFHSASHRKALSCVAYALTQGEGLIVISGETGSGKSTLAAHLRDTVDPQQLTVVPIVSSALSEETLIPLVAEGLGLDIAGHDKGGARRSIEGFFQDEARAGRRCLLIADDAQNLSIGALEELHELVSFQLPVTAPMQILLLGRPELLAMLQRHPTLEPLRQRVIATHHVEPLTRAEIEPYIVYRLGRVGWSGRPQFDQRVFAELHAASAGIPLRINQVASRLLLLGAVERRSRIDAVMLKAVVDEMAAEQAVIVQPPGPSRADSTPAEAPAPRGQQLPFDHETIAAAVAERDAQIAELQQAVVELAGQLEAGDRASVRSEIEALGLQVARLESRIGEQDAALRRMLAMLIDWVEREDEQSRAA